MLNSLQKDPNHTLFLIENCYWLTWNLAHILSNLKNFQKSKKIRHDISCTDVIKYQHFLQETWPLLTFVRLKSLVLFLLCFLAFCEFSCFFYKSTFVSTFTMETFYFILAWKGLKTIKLKKMFFFQPTFNKSAIKINKSSFCSYHYIRK